MSFGLAASVGLSALSGIAGKRDAKRQGKAARKQAQEQDIFNKVAAGQVIAGGQIASFEELRQAEIVSSRAVAVAAAGGYSADIDHLLADIEGEGNYRASIAMWEAETEAERLRFSGEQGVSEAKDFSRDIKKRASNAMWGDILGGMAKGYDYKAHKDG